MALIARLPEKATLDDDRDKKPLERDAQLVRLTEKDDIEMYLTTFERVMEAYEIDKNRWTFKLAPYLSGRAQEVYGSLAAETVADYEQVKEAILVRYGVREETYRLRFRSMKKKTEETYRELANRLQDTVKKWLREYESKDELMDVHVKEQFVNSLPTTLQVWIREREPETSDAAFDMADSFVHARECGSSNGIGRSGWKTEGPGMEHSHDKYSSGQIKLYVYSNAVAVARPEKKRLSRSQKRQNKKQFQNGDKDRPTGEETDGKSRLRSRRTTETPRDRRDTAWH
ncbi:hypothetical protein EMCRGX_G013478 [Ephydatia muelleri]